MSLSKRDRFRVLVRDQFTCRYCGRSAPNVVLEVDHRTPRCEGGSDHQSNLATACVDCNRSKGGTLLPPKMFGDDEENARSRQTAHWWIIGILQDIPSVTPDDEKVQMLLWKAARAHPVRLSLAVDRFKSWARDAGALGPDAVSQFIAFIYEVEAEDEENA